MNRTFTPQVRKTLYLAWMALGPILAAYGVHLPGGKGIWDQLVYIILGIGSLGMGALATKHIQPPPDTGPCRDKPEQ
ncbi:Uncharacterised protein [Mycobacteroides abscessus subsp. bolletii]|uniref:hypothetical protein n=1 Tax=Mycobacteroides abscessus TaxID=36809 RepID=UPI0009C7B013|nr:hypothetical protein [Mycobacteroides abscessus]SLD79554.1 Uncharacterised protein [Mycobacteroides abscessus subsp. bolletii]